MLSPGASTSCASVTMAVTLINRISLPHNPGGVLPLASDTPISDVSILVPNLREAEPCCPAMAPPITYSIYEVSRYVPGKKSCKAKKRRRSPLHTRRWLTPLFYIMYRIPANVPVDLPVIAPARNLRLESSLRRALNSSQARCE